MNTERLIDRAMAYWDVGACIPLDLFADMLGAGLDVETLETKHMQEPV